MHKYLLWLAKVEKSHGRRRGQERRRKGGGNAKLRKNKGEKHRKEKVRVGGKEKKRESQGRGTSSGRDKLETGLRRERKTENKEELQWEPGEVGRELISFFTQLP